MQPFARQIQAVNTNKQSTPYRDQKRKCLQFHCPRLRSPHTGVVIFGTRVIFRRRSCWLIGCGWKDFGYGSFDGGGDGLLDIFCCPTSRNNHRNRWLSYAELVGYRPNLNISADQLRSNLVCFHGYMINEIFFNDQEIYFPTPEIYFFFLITK